MVTGYVNSEHKTTVIQQESTVLFLKDNSGTGLGTYSSQAMNLSLQYYSSGLLWAIWIAV